MHDFLEVAREILESVGNEISMREIPRPADMKDDWFMAELFAGSVASRA